jgi:hypothetical protein
MNNGSYFPRTPLLKEQRDRQASSLATHGRNLIATVEGRL